MSDLDFFSDPYGPDRRPASDRAAARQRQTRRQPGRKAKGKGGRGERGPKPDGRRPGRGPRGKRRRGRAALLFALAFLVAVGGTGGVLGFAWLDYRMNPPDYDGAGSGSVTVQVTDGATGQAIGQSLEEHGVVRSVGAFLRVYSGEPRASAIQPGFYQMRKSMSSEAAMKTLLDPESRADNQIVIPEGRRASEIYTLLAEKTGIPKGDFEKAGKDGEALGLPDYAKGRVEGYLWPGRYDLDPNGSAAAILKVMVNRFHQQAKALDLDEGAKRAGFRNTHELVTFASMLQGEAQLKRDFPRIARVLYNRLEQGWKLQLDSTVLYALNKRTIHVTYKDLEVQSPFSTYHVPALPAGPIENPGATAFQAALKPGKGSWMYFVTTNPSNGYTEYATTNQEFEQLKAKLNKWLRENPE